MSLQSRKALVCLQGQLAGLCCRQVQSNPTLNRKEVIRTKTGDHCPGG